MHPVGKDIGSSYCVSCIDVKQVGCPLKILCHSSLQKTETCTDYCHVIMSFANPMLTSVEREPAFVNIYVSLDPINHRNTYT